VTTRALFASANESSVVPAARSRMLSECRLQNLVIAGDTPAITAQLLGAFLRRRGLVLGPHTGKRQGDDDSNRNFEEAVERNDPGGV
jgi:hypothetical protein